MQTLFVILFLLSGVGLVVGLIKPSLFKQSRKMISLMFGGAAVVFFIALAVVSPSQPQPQPQPQTPVSTVAASESTSSVTAEATTPTVQPTQAPVTTAKKTTPVQTQTSSAANTPAPTPTPAPVVPAQPTVQLSISGSGSKSTQTFTVGKSWTLDWTYDCSNFGSKGNFQVYVYDSNGNISFDNSGVNQLGASGADTEYYHTAGSYYLEVNSECNWTTSVKG